MAIIWMSFEGTIGSLSSLIWSSLISDTVITDTVIANMAITDVVRGPTVRRESTVALAGPDYSALAPELQLFLESTSVIMNVFLGIILTALLFGITNTMLMSVFDRVREFGMLMAVGMKRRQVFVMVMTETVFLSLTGGAAGMILGGLLFLRDSGQSSLLSATGSRRENRSS